MEKADDKLFQVSLKIKALTAQREKGEQLAKIELQALMQDLAACESLFSHLPAEALLEVQKLHSLILKRAQSLGARLGKLGTRLQLATLTTLTTPTTSPVENTVESIVDFEMDSCYDPDLMASLRL